jgi:hypothetical protein
MLSSPSFLLFPTNNNRTAWKPVKFPVILVATNRYDPLGIPIDNSEIFNVRIYIENVPHEARVAGHQHIGMRFPDRELYARNIQPLELSDKYIPLTAFTDSNGVPVTNPQDNDIVTYTTSTGITSTLQYTKGAEYYDLSDITVEVEQLPSSIYNLVYECSFFSRVVSIENQEELLCIDTNTTALSQTRILINHPGEILEELFNRTPGILFTAQNKASDKTIEFYRPFSDTLQNILDEQNLLRSLNWIYDAPAESLPLISDLLGWNVPYFPQSLDKLRKAVLRKTVELQHLKGSKQAITELFKLFGFEILITNLWISKDGSRLIRPNQSLPIAYQDQEIPINIVPQIDAILNNYRTNGYGSLTIPLLFKPQEVVGLDNFAALQAGGNITLDAYIVDVSSDAYTTLTSIISDIESNPNNYGETSTFLETDGYLLPISISDAMRGLEVLGHSQILISGKFGEAADEVLVGQEPPLSKLGCSLDRLNNNLSITFNGYIDFTDTAIFAFASYKKAEYDIPPDLINLQSNWFDIQLLTQDLEESADPTTLEFALEFLRNVKAFHSLLNVVAQRIELNDDYEVTDLKIGGNIKQRYDIDFGKLQVPPAILPLDPSNSCTSQDPKDLGYKDSDLLYRSRKIQSLIEEFTAALLYEDGAIKNQNRTKEDISTGIEFGFVNPTTTAGQGDAQSIETIDPSANSYTANANSSEYSSFIREYTEDRTPYEELDGSSDYYYAGRIKDDILYQSTIKIDDFIARSPCLITYSSGVYWTYPTYSEMYRRGVSGNIDNSRKILYTSGRPSSGEQIDGIQQSYITSTGNITSDTISNLNIMYRKSRISIDTSLHYSNRPYPEYYDQNWYVALNKPSLNVTKTNMHLPGCRFPRYGIKTTYTHPLYNKKPWDDDYCSDPTFMDAILVNDTAGDEVLSYPVNSITYTGNGLDQDIFSYGDHSDYTGDTSRVIHKIYLNQFSGHEAIEWEDDDQVSSVITDIINVSNPIFNSYNECGSNFVDFADGYASLSGYQTYNEVIRNNIDRDGSNSELLIALGCPVDPVSITALFLYGSGIQVENGYRYDCGCLLTPCGVTNITDVTWQEDIDNTICSIDNYVDADGKYDFGYDLMTIDQRLRFDESIGIADVYFNGGIGSFLESV